jgi:hypothetical protein
VRRSGDLPAIKLAQEACCLMDLLNESSIEFAAACAAAIKIFIEEAHDVRCAPLLVHGL